MAPCPPSASAVVANPQTTTTTVAAESVSSGWHLEAARAELSSTRQAFDGVCANLGEGASSAPSVKESLKQVDEAYRRAEECVNKTRAALSAASTLYARRFSRVERALCSTRSTRFREDHIEPWRVELRRSLELVRAIRTETANFHARNSQKQRTLAAQTAALDEARRVFEALRGDLDHWLAPQTTADAKKPDDEALARLLARCRALSQSLQEDLVAEAQNSLNLAQAEYKTKFRYHTSCSKTAANYHIATVMPWQNELAAAKALAADLADVAAAAQRGRAHVPTESPLLQER